MTSPRRCPRPCGCSSSAAPRPGSTSSGCASTPTSRSSSRPTFSSRRSWPRASPCWLRSRRHRARLRRRALGQRVRRAGGCVVDRRRGDDRPRPGARARHAEAAGAPGGMAAILGLDDDVVERICKRIRGVGRPTTTAPAACCLGRERRCRRVLRPGRGGWSAAHGEAARLGCVPLPAGWRAAGRSAGGGQGALRRAGGALHVHGDGSGRVGAAHRSAARRPADGARSLHGAQPSSYATALARSWRSGRATSCRGSSSASTRA